MRRMCVTLVMMLLIPGPTPAGEDVPPAPRLAIVDQAVPVAPVYPDRPPAPTPGGIDEARLEQLVERVVDKALATRLPGPTAAPIPSPQAPAGLPLASGQSAPAAAGRVRVQMPVHPARKAVAALGRRMATWDRPRERELPVVAGPVYASGQH